MRQFYRPLPTPPRLKVFLFLSSETEERPGCEGMRAGPGPFLLSSTKTYWESVSWALLARTGYSRGIFLPTSGWHRGRGAFEYQLP